VSADAVVSRKGAHRWASGHPWIYRSDVTRRPDAAAGAVLVRDTARRPLGWALWSPASEISLRLLDARADAVIGAAWWRDRLQASAARRASLGSDVSAWRVAHAEADGCPSLVVDRYDRWLVIQLLSAGLEAFRAPILDALIDLCAPAGVLARNDAAVRTKEGLARETVLLAGDVPREIEVREHGVRYLAAPWDGQKTGAFLDQRENRVLAGQLARGRALDCFSYHGSFALHMAQRADRVTAVDSSLAALARARENAARNAIDSIDFVEADVFEYLRDAESRGDRYETIVLDPPAFAKTRGALASALRGYKEINLRAMRLLSSGGILLTASCSFHLSKPLFLEMLTGAAADSGRRMTLRHILGQPLDHPEVLTIPETGYIKAAVIQAE
jgi:23S rRNA (cytosine1962-C5)-methyltransferase